MFTVFGRYKADLTTRLKNGDKTAAVRYAYKQKTIKKPSRLP
jgi:hypothetical protein